MERESPVPRRTRGVVGSRRVSGRIRGELHPRIDPSFAVPRDNGFDRVLVVHTCGVDPKCARTRLEVGEPRVLQFARDNPRSN